ncbi:TetR/AcrR family transcriptional regulator [Nocardioides caeni]
MTTTTSSRTRLSPDERRTQLLDLGVRLLATTSLEELSIDVLAEEAGISRGLLYHYFGTKLGFFEAVVQHAADDLYRQTAPPAEGEPLERLMGSITGYVDYVVANQPGYRSLVRAASGGNDTLRRIYDDTFRALADRFFAVDTGTIDLPDTPAVRLVLHAWQAMTEALVLRWCDDPAGLTRDDLLRVIVDSLLPLLAALP